MKPSKVRQAGLIKNLIFICLVVLILGGCGTNQTTTTPQTTTTTTTPWTVMVYMALDNDLSSHADPNLIEMQKSGSTDSVNIVALVDKPSVNTKRYLVKKNATSTTVDSPYYDYGRNIDTGSVTELKNFVTAVFRDYPAQNYMLILSGHAGGVMDAKSLTPVTKSICSDSTSNNAITTPELGAALKELTASKTIQALATDACLMGMFEVMYELRDSNINYLVLSETTIPGTGYPYDGSWLSGITGTTTGREISANLVTDYYNHYVNLATQSITLSGIDFSKFKQGEIITEYNNLATALAGLGADDLNTVRNTIIPGAQHFAAKTSQYWYNYVDLRNFCENLVNNNIAPTQAAALYDDLAVGDNNAVFISRAYSGTADGELVINTASGMTSLICDPLTDSYSRNWQGYYENLKYFTDGNTNWAAFLTAIAP